jgi:hypothetical protein
MAAAITAYARMDVYEAMMSLGPDNVIACDTDSLKSQIPFPRSSPLLFKGLGGWVNELADKVSVINGVNYTFDRDPEWR